MTQTCYIMIAIVTFTHQVSLYCIAILCSLQLLKVYYEMKIPEQLSTKHSSKILLVFNVEYKTDTLMSHPYS